MYKISYKFAKRLYNEFQSKIKEEKMEDLLLPYQAKILEYVQTKTFLNKKLLLLYMETGTGKTLTSLVSAISLLERKLVKRIVLLSPKSIQNEFIGQFIMYCKMVDPTMSDSKKQMKLGLIKSKILTVCYNSNKTLEYFNSLSWHDETVYIVDEAHLFLKSIIKANIPEDKNDPNYNENAGQCLKIYEKMKKLKKSFFLFLTGTPSAKTPFELVPMFNLIRLGFPESVDVFMEQYFTDTSINPKVIKELRNKLEGLVVYVKGDNSSQNLKTKPLEEVEVEMSTQQYKQYLEDLKQEFAENGYTKSVNKFGWGFGQISSFHAKSFGDSIIVPDKQGNINSKTAPKIVKMYEDTEKIVGKVCFYFRFTEKGVDTMRRYLESKGYTIAGNNYDEIFNKTGKHFICFTGNEPMNVKYNHLKAFNEKMNAYGEYIKYILLSPSGSVGINLFAIRFLGIGSVEYNYSNIRQIMGRCNRVYSHMQLPENDRKLDNKIYIATKNKAYCKKNKNELKEWYTRLAPNHNEEFPSIERCIYQDSIEDDKLNEVMREFLRDMSII